jgi:dTDP-glucose pyrophosphorylase
MKSEINLGLCNLETTLREALAIINASDYQIAIVIDGNESVVGVATDGDVRRGLLNGVELEDKLLKVANLNPVLCDSNQSFDYKKRMLKSSGVRQLIIVDKSNKPIGVLGQKSLGKDARDNKVVIMAGGQGKRLYPLTESMPKPMLTIGNVPILELIIRSCKDQGFEKFIISLGHLGDQISNYFNDGSNLDIEIEYVTEDSPLGTAGALSMIAGKVDSPFIVMNGDVLNDINLSDMLNQHEERENIATVATRTYSHQIPFGVMRVDGDQINRIIEKPVMTEMISAGIYVFEPNVILSIPQGQFLDMPELLEEIISKNQPVGTYKTDAFWLDIGRHEELDKAREVMGGA